MPGPIVNKRLNEISMCVLACVELFQFTPSAGVGCERLSVMFITGLGSVISASAVLLKFDDDEFSPTKRSSFLGRPPLKFSM